MGLTFNFVVFPFLTALSACLLLAWLAPWLALVDKPDARKQHVGAVPVVGGIAIMLAYILAVKVRGISGNLSHAIVPVGLMLAVGILDDMRPLSARVKLVAQFFAAWLLLRTSGFVLASIPVPGLAGGIPLDVLAVPVSLLVIVAVTNAINMADGADGLAGGYLLVALLTLAVVAWQGGDGTSFLLIAGLISALLGFLACNARHPWQARARVFLGDAGALALGLLLCWFALMLARGPRPAMPSVLLLYAAALPVMDMVTVSVRRMLRGVSPMRADRSHLHHLLLYKGYSVELSVPMLWALDAALAGLGLVLWRLGASAGLLLLVFIGLLLAKMAWLRVWESVDVEPAP
ncbi:MAG: undecaprenyl/decaprenyl-phosphate alpha-N-acetylglucosaminyl 1-phosphate transferase [Uliginosibacterium sp.]|jgi:UDP-GlcNAc:undecaprenyl-phosphate GlcNAc-1-phosphate transferase|nr:undecaprenyl/decaprenyl-phosphate alpha-N-acetylglucosaminyl 1-phosphate transferase [Uliginosibacterium sp.]